MKNFVMGVIVTLLAVLIFCVLFVRSSYMPVAASDPPLPFERTLAKIGLHARIQREAPERDVSHFATADLVAGAQVYQKNCAFCHGLPNQPPSAASQGMFPHAPQLFTQQETVSDDPAGVTFWKVKNGIRLTGMPGFKSALSDEQIWQVAALLAHSESLPPEVLDALKPPPIPILVTAGAANPASVPAAETPKPK